MRIVALVALSIAALSPTQADAHPRLSIQAEAMMSRPAYMRQAVAQAGEPLARVRGVTGSGLTPIAFARWIASHPRVAAIDGRMLQLTSSRTSLLNRTAALFADADRNGDQRVSTIELADFVAIPDRTRMNRSDRFTEKNNPPGVEMASNP